MDKLLQELQASFEAFKTANDERLEKMAKGEAVSEVESKVEKAAAHMDEIKRRLDEIEAKQNRPPRASADGDPVKSEHKEAWEKWLRKGKGEEELRSLEQKALNVTTDGDGGYAVPEQVDREILSLMQTFSPMRSVARVITVGTPDYKKLVNKHGAAYGWVDEDDARPETNTPTLAQVAAVMGEIYANPAATQTMLDDVFFNAESWLAEELSEAFALGEGASFVTGNGTKRPKGFLDYMMASTKDGVRAFGTIQYVPTGADGAFKTTSATVNPADDLLDLIHAMKGGNRQGAVFMMNSATLGAVRKWKDNDGAYIWRPGIEAGQPSNLLGYPVVENEDMPDIGSGTTPIAFGNFRRGYYIVDRIGIRSLRDPYTNKPYVQFYTTKRVGGMLVDSEAIKVLKMSAT